MIRYRRNEKFTWHLDALGPTQATDETGGQRTVTLLVYLTDLEEGEGGATMFRDLGQDGQPLRVYVWSNHCANSGIVQLSLDIDLPLF